jgi:hypothetical protein
VYGVRDNPSRDGRRQVDEFLFAGDLFGCETLDTYDFSAAGFAQRDVEALAGRGGASDRLRGVRQFRAVRI